LAFNETGQLLGPVTEDTRISDPRGLGVDDGLLFLNSGSDRILALDGKGRVVRDSGLIPGLNPGGGNFGPDGRHYVGSRSARTIVAFAPTLASPGEPVLSPAVVPFARGFAFRQDGILFLASGIRPGGEGDNTILAFDPERRMRAERKRGREQRASVRRSGRGDDNPRVRSDRRPSRSRPASGFVDEIQKTSWPSLRTGQQALLRGAGRSRRVRFRDGQKSGLGRQSTALERPSRDLLWIKRTTMG
jgi:hypothetical protein